MHDRTRGKGVLLLSLTPPTCVHTIGYADDLALTENGDEAGTARATARASEIAAGSRSAAGMIVKIVKKANQAVKQIHRKKCCAW